MAADHTVATGLALLAAQAPLEPGQLLEDVRLTVRGILRARRDHSASISFLELSDSSDEAEQMLQVCINRAKCDDTPSTKHALEQLNIGDTLCCSGPPGRTRTGRAEPTLFARSIALVRATREPARVLRLLAAWRAGELGIDETSRALGAEPSTLRALLPALGPVLAASRRGAEAQQERVRPASEESDGEAGPVVPRVAPARLERLREVAARRQAGLVLVMEEIHHLGNVGAMLRSCEAFGVSTALLVHAHGAPRLPLGCDVEGAMRGSSASADVWVELQHIDGTAAAFAWLEERGYANPNPNPNPDPNPNPNPNQEEQRQECPNGEGISGLKVFRGFIEWGDKVNLGPRSRPMLTLSRKHI